jgi:hypothetical protein
MNPYVRSLEFPCALFKADMDPYTFPKTRHTRLGTKCLNPELVELFQQLSLNIVLVEVFYSRPFFYSGIHIDSTGSDINKINWVFGGQDCDMHWYSVKPTVAQKEIKNTVIDTTYQPFTLMDVNLEHTAVLSSPSLVHVGVPHNVHNKHHDRWCVSVVYKFLDSAQRPTMAESLNLFKDFLI